MTRRYEIEQHLHSMQDIREIMNSMKNLSLMETRKLSRFLSSQQRVVNSIEQAAVDFLAAYPHLHSTSPPVSEVYILIGSEQGFCGDFNQALIEAFSALIAESSTADIKLVVIGTKLYSILQDHPQLIKALNGPTVAQEVDTVLTELINTVGGLHSTLESLSITALHHEHEIENIQITSVLPPFQNLQLKQGQYVQPPRLLLSPEHFYTTLVDHYLFAALYEMFYTSLMAEHYRRVQHLEGAIDRLEQQADELGKKRNMLRQEEITEEIEVIMLSAGIIK
ncbi:F0F1 ATP synthase subunit gamma [Kaarinaea lacus]